MASVEEIAEDGAKNSQVEGRKSYSQEYVITAYCPCEQCCGKNDGITASGAIATEGVTIAMSSSIPFGTRVYIGGVGERIVQDRGGSITGNRIDLFFNDHQSALNFGVQTKEVIINY